jgi:hypothetical protein
MDYEISICWVLYGIVAIFALSVGTGKIPKQKTKLK